MWEEIGVFHKQGQDENWWWSKARAEEVLNIYTELSRDGEVKGFLEEHCKRK